MINRMINDMENLIGMLESDMSLTGRYGMSNDTKRYVKNVKQEMEDTLENWKESIPENTDLY